MGHETLIKCTVAASLIWDENNERAIDRVTAIAMASQHNELGAAILRAEALDVPSLRKTIFLIVRHLTHRYKITRGYADKIAKAVLHEYMRPHCIMCGGKGHEYHKALMVTCPHCSGTGLHHYSNSERVALIGGSYNEKVYEDALGYVRDAIKNIVTSSNKRLA